MYLWWQERPHVCAFSRTACMTVWLLHERRVYLSGYNSDLIPFSSHRCFFTMWLLQQPNKQTNTHMGIQTPYYPHIADAAWFGLHFSRCHSNGKPGSKSEYPLWCLTPPYGKINDSGKPGLSPLPLLLNFSSAETLQRPLICQSDPKEIISLLHRE